ncbi:MAG: hypothetical protein SFW67_36065 [Myxococcaceae bacterium]|nr:hypothetical protein [Myxococcaceae bacterium]
MRCFVLLLAVALSACGAAPPAIPDDAGRPPLDTDAGAALDAGASADGGPATDAGTGDAGAFDPDGRLPVEFFDNEVMDSRRSRAIAYRIYFSPEARGALPVAVFSHGGDGAQNAHTRLGHFGTEWASAGFLAIHLNHLPSAGFVQHLVDRPADVTHLLDRLAAGTLPLPPALRATADLSRVAHGGHSYGAYTTHALAGGRFLHGSAFGDARIKAIIPISPQGPGNFGAYDNGPSDNTWGDIALPALHLVGGLEKDGPINEPMRMTDWRLQPFLRSPSTPDRFLAVIPGQDHNDMVAGSPEVQRFILLSTRRFLQVFLLGRAELVCDIAFARAPAGTDSRRKTDPLTGLARGCR